MVRWDTSLSRITTRLIVREKAFDPTLLRKELDAMLAPYTAVPDACITSIWIHDNDPLANAMNAVIVGMEFQQEEFAAPLENTLSSFLGFVQAIGGDPQKE